jgi:hypothetical protein
MEWVKPEKTRMVPCAGPENAPPDLFVPDPTAERVMKAFDRYERFHALCGNGVKRTKDQWKKLHDRMQHWMSKMTEHCEIGGKPAIVTATNYSDGERGLSWWWVKTSKTNKKVIKKWRNYE